MKLDYEEFVQYEVPAVLRRLVAEGWCGLEDRHPEAALAFQQLASNRITGDVHDPAVQRAIAEGCVEFLRRYGVDPVPEVMAVALHDGSVAMLVPGAALARRREGALRAPEGAPEGKVAPEGLPAPGEPSLGRR